MTQKVSLQFFDAADAKEVNARLSILQQIGIYRGGYITKITDSQVSVSALVCEISDGTYQVKVDSDAAELVTVSIAAPYVVLRWVYAESPSNVMTYVGVASVGILANDIVVGQCIYAGSIMTGFDYVLRTTPDVHDLFLKVVPTIPASMQVRVKPGKINYGVQNYNIIDQISGVLIAPTTNPRIDLIYADTDGIIKVFTGVEAVTPVAPDYNGKSGLAEITLTVGMTTIPVTSITDVRAFLSGGGYAIYAP